LVNRTLVSAALCVASLTAQTYRAGSAGRAYAKEAAIRWRGAQTHALITEIWYPAAGSAVEQPRRMGPLFDAGMSAPDAPPAAGKHALILLSHGTGGSALQLAWLGTSLARRGYIAAAVNHPGNNALEPYTAHGFLMWWERARDLSLAIDELLRDPELGRHIDPSRIGAAGFSLGGYTVIALAGGLTNFDAFMRGCEAGAGTAYCKPPPEFPDLLTAYRAMKDSDSEFRASVAQAGHSYKDPRIRAVFAIAPPLESAFQPASLNAITVPVALLVGAADPLVAPDEVRRIAKAIRSSTLHVVPGAGHYTFLDECTPAGRTELPQLCVDAPGVDRRAVHQDVARRAAQFFDAKLSRGGRR
jgi:predicted dienelactone hydrolase